MSARARTAPPAAIESTATIESVRITADPLGATGRRLHYTGGGRRRRTDAAQSAESAQAAPADCPAHAQRELPEMSCFDSPSAREHSAAAPRAVACAVLTVSDTRTLADDKSGALIVELLEAAGHRAAARSIVPDEPSQVAAA